MNHLEDGWWQQEPKGAVWHTVKFRIESFLSINSNPDPIYCAQNEHKAKAQKIKGSYHEGVGTIYYQVMDEMS